MLRKAPFRLSRNGSVYAVRIAPERWGFVRFRDTTRFGILPVYARSAGLPKIVWADNAEKWHSCQLSGAKKFEADDYVLVGQMPLADPEVGFPDTCQVPRFSWQPWVVFRGSSMVYVKGPQDVVGMQRHRFLNAGDIRDLIFAKYEAGELAEVEVEPQTKGAGSPASAPAGDDVSTGPRIVFAKIASPIHPAQREQEYEEPLGEFLAEHDIGLITGGGTMQDKDGSVLFAGIDIEVDDVERAVPLIARKLAELGAPEGSVIEYGVDDQTVEYPIKRSKPKRKNKRTDGA